MHLKASMLGKMGAGTIADKAANLRSLYGFVWMYPGKKLLFMGSEFGQRSEWNYDAGLDWDLLRQPEHEGLRVLVRDLNRLYTGDPVLGTNDFRPDSFRWVNCTDGDHSTISFLRTDPAGKAAYLVVGNFTPMTRTRFLVGVPHRGYWREVLNTNSSFYGGAGFGNHGGRQASTALADGFEQSLSLTLPGLSVLVFKWSADAPGIGPQGVMRRGTRCATLNVERCAALQRGASILMFSLSSVTPSWRSYSASAL
ncbi:MAG: alpha amylase C-terminal domain-containing protein [Lacunisphaera sp.]